MGYLRAVLLLIPFIVICAGVSAQVKVVVVPLGEDQVDNHLMVCQDIVPLDIGGDTGTPVTTGQAGLGLGDDYPNDLILGSTHEQTFLWNAPNAGVFTIYTSETLGGIASPDTVLEISSIDCSVPQVSNNNGGLGNYSAIHLTVNSGQQFLIHVSKAGNGEIQAYDLNIVQGALTELSGVSITPSSYDARGDDIRDIPRDDQFSECPVACSHSCINGQCAASVFVTNTVRTGNLGGLSGADALCQQEADTAGLRGTYSAWLSDSNGSPDSRFTKLNQPYMRTDGTVVANNWADLTDGSLLAPINLNAAGTAPVSTCSTSFVWTNTNISGELDTAQHCNNWTTAASTTAVGRMSGTNSTWTRDTLAACNMSTVCLTGSDEGARLYCIQQ